jgi:hypothetical protein
MGTPPRYRPCACEALPERVQRLDARLRGSAWLPNALATAKAGQHTTVNVYAKHAACAAHLGTVKLTATSESDPTKKATTVCAVVG